LGTPSISHRRLRRAEGTPVGDGPDWPTAEPVSHIVNRAVRDAVAGLVNGSEVDRFAGW